MPEQYRKRKKQEAEFSFYAGVKKVWKYNAIFHLLFHNMNEPRDEYQIAYFLLKRRWPRRDWNEYFLNAE